MERASKASLAPVLKRLTQSSATYNQERLDRALRTAKEAYGESAHHTGVTVMRHVLEVLEKLAVFEPDEDAVIACLLHHVLEQKAMTLAELEHEFGPKVRELVSGVHLLSHVTLEGRRKSIEDLRVMLLSVSDDIRVLFISLCDRACKLAYVDNMEPSSAKRLCQDVIQLFAPVAARLGIYSLKHELENGAFPVVHPVDSSRITEQLQHLHAENPQFLDRASSALLSFLTEHQIAATVEGREKQSFSIFQKMHSKSFSSIRDIYDLFALRVIVQTEEDCYRVLGLLHRLGHPLANRFKDYIAFPKPNGYQSLHTTLAGFADLPEDCFLEVQIRTEQMHREAQYGIAAHWSYKEHGATDAAMQKVQLHSMLLSQESVEDASNETSFADHIFVLTPRGDIIELPEGATPLDFAFQVHTDLGLSFRSAKVNGSIVSLDYELENGDVVEIQKHASPQPTSQWMKVLKMGSSRSRLRRYLYTQDRPKLVTMGREQVNAELKKKGLPLLTTDLSILRVCDGQTLTHHEREDLLLKIGQGSEKASSLLPRLAALKDQIETAPQKKKSASRMQRKEAVVGMEGNAPMPIRYAKCCSPDAWPRHNIAGNINREGEVMIHRDYCRMYKQTNPERRIEVWWK